MKHFWYKNNILKDPKPQRIISLVPSQTELLYSLGLEKEVEGITKFCLHPAQWRQEKTIVGGTKSVHKDIIKVLSPDLIIGNKEENTEEMIEELKDIAPIFITDIYNLEDALSMISSVGKITNRVEKATEIATTIADQFATLKTSNQNTLKAAYFIWRDPWMVVGSQNFIHELFPYLQLKNAFEHLERYPVIDWQDPIWKEVDIILLSSEPYPFKEKHIEEVQKHVPHAQIILVDGELFSWYGSRLIQTPAYFNSLKESIIYSST